MGSRSLAIALCLLTAGAAWAEGDEKPDVRANWLQRPSERDIMAVWPREAWAKGVGGRVTLKCRVSLRGTLTDCTVAAEEPEGSGFGEAALALVPQFLLKPGLRDGKPVESDIGIPIRFATPDLPTGTYIPGAGTVGGKTSLSNIVWLEAPAYDEVVAAYPRKAREKRQDGRVALNCQFKADGRLGYCQTIQEEPSGYGLAAAAKTLTPRFLGPDQLPNGDSTKGMVAQIAFVFDSDMLDADKRVVGKPSWAKLPTGAEVVAGYPVAAAKAGVRGARVVVGCTVAAQGRLGTCAVESEDPTGYGFGVSALTLAGSFQVKPWSDEGLPMIGAKLRVPIRFQLPDAPPAP